MTRLLPRAFLNATLGLGRVSSVSVTSVRFNYTHIEHARSTSFKQSHRTLPHPSEKIIPEPRIKVPNNFRSIYPDFLPDPRIDNRNKLREKLERLDMLSRRKHIDIPEFYVGSIMAVTVHDPNATGKSSRFVGICLERGGCGLRAWFNLRNVIDHQGLEIMYEMYCPLISAIETLRLERRLDDSLLYLRDALPEYSYFPQDMEAELMAENAPVPLNDTKVRLIDGLWHSPWERREMKGIQFENLTEEMLYEADKRKTPHYVQFDLMKDYRATIPEEEQEAIFREMAPHYPALQASQRKFRKRKLAGES